MSSHSNANIEDLPVEILERILFSITDLRSPYHLITASPAASYVFASADVGLKALDSILRQTMAPDVIALARLVALVRVASLERPLRFSQQVSLLEFARKYTECYHGRYSTAPRLARLLRGQPPQLMRGILLTVRRICCLAWACLEHYRGQWSSVTPCHLDSKFAWGYIHEKPWRQNPPGSPYSPPPLGPPIWLEEQRVMRGFWRLQLLIDLKLAISENRLDWALEDSQKEISPDVLFAGWTWQKEEFLTVVDFVDHIQGGSILSHMSESLPAPPQNYASSQSWQDPALEEAVRPKWPRGIVSQYQPPCWRIYVFKLSKSPLSPIRGVPFWPYRRLGLAIWEKDKLEALELSGRRYASRGDGQPCSLDDVVFTWRSLLSQDLIAELQETMEEDFQRNGIIEYGTDSDSVPPLYADDEI